MAQHESMSWHSFENAIAALYRALGAETVQQNVNLAGNQIDIYIEERTTTGQLIRTAVDCKFFSKAVPKDVVVQAAIIATFLKQAGLIDTAVIVASQGFTQAASLAAEVAGIGLISYLDLEARLRIQSGTHTSMPLGRRSSLESILYDAEHVKLPDAFPDTVFVAMPFSELLEDLYIYGIRKCVQQVGLGCKRADEIQHGGAIITQVVDLIRRSRITIAELSDHNPNVFYEIGWAHALDRPTILLVREGVELPFDVRHINTIIYRNIHQLEERLLSRLQGMLASNP